MSATSDYQPTSVNSEKLVFNSYQIFIVALLAFLQFTIILDFMIISPLGALLMPALKITPAQFGTVVSAYAFSAGVSGFLAASIADKFDRKTLLLVFYIGFLVGTLACALSPSFEALFAARIITGLFAGVIGSTVLAIATDLFPMQMRGRVMGFIQTAFGASQVLGIPVGLYFANLWGWHAPFLLIVVIGLFVGGVIWYSLRPINAHLRLQNKNENPVKHLLKTLLEPNYRLAFFMMAFLSLGGFMLMPFGSAYAVNNLGISMKDLPLVYLVTGITSLFLGPVVGRLSDRYGNFRIFLFGTGLSIISVLIYTNLPPTTVWVLMAVNVVLFVSIFSRMVPAQAVNASIPVPENRGSYMSISSSIQQVAGGVASSLAGYVVAEGPHGEVLHFNHIGIIFVFTVLTSMTLMFFVNRSVSIRANRTQMLSAK